MYPIIIIDKLRGLNVEGNVYNYLDNFLREQTGVLKIAKIAWLVFKIVKGLPQGSALKFIIIHTFVI